MGPAKPARQRGFREEFGKEVGLPTSAISASAAVKRYSRTGQSGHEPKRKELSTDGARELEKQIAPSGPRRPASRTNTKLTVYGLDHKHYTV